MKRFSMRYTWRRQKVKRLFITDVFAVQCGHRAKSPVILPYVTSQSKDSHYTFCNHLIISILHQLS